MGQLNKSYWSQQEERLHIIPFGEIFLEDFREVILIHSCAYLLVIPKAKLTRISLCHFS